jgi:hypothetical protein
MKTRAFTIAVASAALIAVGGCNNTNGTENGPQTQTPKAE